VVRNGTKSTARHNCGGSKGVLGHAPYRFKDRDERSGLEVSLSIHRKRLVRKR
jgi:hypothetical protein